MVDVGLVGLSWKICSSIWNAESVQLFVNKLHGVLFYFAFRLYSCWIGRFSGCLAWAWAQRNLCCCCEWRICWLQKDQTACCLSKQWSLQQHSRFHSIVYWFLDFSYTWFDWIEKKERNWWETVLSFNCPTTQVVTTFHGSKGNAKELSRSSSTWWKQAGKAQFTAACVMRAFLAFSAIFRMSCLLTLQHFANRVEFWSTALTSYQSMAVHMAPMVPTQICLISRLQHANLLFSGDEQASLSQCLCHWNSIQTKKQKKKKNLHVYSFNPSLHFSFITILSHPVDEMLAFLSFPAPWRYYSYSPFWLLCAAHSSTML